MDDKRFVNDNKVAFQPFSTGPRNCVGRKYVLAFPFLILCDFTDSPSCTIVWRMSRCESCLLDCCGISISLDLLQAVKTGKIRMFIFSGTSQSC